MRALPRITALIGSGATIDIGAPSTPSLTEAIRNPAGNLIVTPEQTEIIRRIFARLTRYYPKGRNGPVNFEDVFHAVEQLVSLRHARWQGTVKEFKPIIGAFVRDAPWVRSLSEMHLFSLLRIFRFVIGDQINNHCESFSANPSADWFKNFWRQLGRRFNLNIATLNYDNLFEQIFGPHQLHDGYANTHPYALSFSPENLMAAKKHRLLHLHGSILFGSPHPSRPAPPEPSADFHGLHKFHDYTRARQAWEVGATENHAQSGDMAAIGPLITGHRKTDKLLVSPYLDYYYQLHESLMQNERLLVIGYGFGDYHINALLRRMKAWHGDRRRIVLINYIDDFHRKTWCPHNAHFGWGPPPLFQFFAAVASEAQPFPPFGYKNPNRIGSDNRGMMFFEGFREAATHFDTIVDFLST